MDKEWTLEDGWMDAGKMQLDGGAMEEGWAEQDGRRRRNEVGKIVAG